MKTSYLAMITFAVVISFNTGKSDILSDQQDEQFENACYEGNIQIVIEMLSHGFPPQGHRKRLNAPIFYAISTGHGEVVKLLLDHGVDPNFDWGVNGGNLLTNAADSGHLDVVKILINAGANVNRSIDHSALYYARIADHIEVERYLRSKGAHFNSYDLKILNELKK